VVLPAEGGIGEASQQGEIALDLASRPTGISAEARTQELPRNLGDLVVSRTREHAAERK
jgi:hypothetical protein